MKTKFVGFSDNVIDGLEQQVKDFFETVSGQWEIKQISHSSAYDSEADHIMFSVFIVYETK